MHISVLIAMMKRDMSNAPSPHRPLGPLYLAAVALIVLAGGMLYATGKLHGEATTWAPTSPASFTDPSSSGPPETQAAVMVAQLAIMRASAVPTVRPTVEPPTPMPTAPWWEAYPSCATMTPGSLCRPQRFDVTTPEPAPTCSPQPNGDAGYVKVCAWPTAVNVGTANDEATE